MKNYAFRVDDFEKEEIDKVKESLNMTSSEFWITCFVFYCDHHKIKIKNDIKLKYEKYKMRELNRNMFFFKNALQAVYMQIEWQLRLKNNTYDENRIVIIIKKYLDMYEKLPDDIKIILKNERDDFAKLMDRNQLENHVARIRPPSIKKLVYKA